MNARQSNPPAAAVVPQQADVRGAYERIQKAIEADRDKLVTALAAVHVKPERFLSVVDQALRRSPALLECTPASILKALLDAAELGLVPSGLIGQAYLVPYRNKRTGRKEAQLIPGYRGLCDLARRSGEVRAIEARTVRANDDFTIILGTDGVVRHIPYINRSRETIEVENPDRPGELLSIEKDGGPYIGAYMIATLAGDVKQIEWMPWAEIEAVRRRSRASDDGPWVTDPGEMGKKTVTRRGVKYLPIAIDSPLNRALALEDEAEANATPAVKIVSSEARRGLEAALGIAVEEPEAETSPEPPQEAVALACSALDAEGYPCTEPAGHGNGAAPTAHKSANYIWPVADAGA